MLILVYKQLGLGTSKPTSLRLLMADQTIQKLIGILCDVLVKVASFIFLANFMILDCEVYFDVFII